MLLFEPIILVPGIARTDRHRLAGTVYVDGFPAVRRVMVHRRTTMELVAATSSDPTTGAWAVSGLPEYPERDLIVLSLDSTGAYNAEVADYVSQVATP